jgi:hypothetical protein
VLALTAVVDEAVALGLLALAQLLAQLGLERRRQLLARRLLQRLDVWRMRGVRAGQVALACRDGIGSSLAAHG